MSDQEEWGSWYNHTGDCIPSNLRFGDVVQVHSECNETGKLEYGVAVMDEAAFAPHNWFWGQSTHDTLRYRIRKPRALRELQAMIENLPAPKVRETVE